MVDLSEIFGLFSLGLGAGVVLAFIFAVIGIGVSSLMRIFTAEDIDR